jgi:hypothetical protein
MRLVSDALSQYVDSPEHPSLDKFRNIEVVAEHDSMEKPWPLMVGKNVTFWWQLKDGHVIGMNENQNTGLSFVIGKKLLPTCVK